MIKAIKNGQTRQFTDEQWSNMPKNKFGWEISSNVENSNQLSTDIIQKKMVIGRVVDVVPEEIVIQKKAAETVKENAVPEEIKTKRGRPKQ